MIIRVSYCRMRKDGTINEVTFDTERKIYSDRENSPEFLQKHRAFVEAKVSCDVTELRKKLVQDGYVCVD